MGENRIGLGVENQPVQWKEKCKFGVKCQRIGPAKLWVPLDVSSISPKKRKPLQGV